MRDKKIIYVLILILMTLPACTQVSLAAQKTAMPSAVRQAEQAVIPTLEGNRTVQEVKTQPEVSQTEQEIKSQPDISPTELVAPTQTEVSPTETIEPTQPEANQNLEAICFRNSDETRLLINNVYGYCLQYPAEYDLAFFTPASVMVFKKSVLNATDPNFILDIQSANGVTVEQAANKIFEDYTVPGLESYRTEISVDGVKAIVLDGLTGQDPNRRVVIVHNDTLYNFYFALMSREQPEVVAQAEELYNTVIQTLNFHPECNLYSPCP